MLLKWVFLRTKELQIQVVNKTLDGIEILRVKVFGRPEEGFGLDAALVSGYGAFGSDEPVSNINVSREVFRSGDLLQERGDGDIQAEIDFYAFKNSSLSLSLAISEMFDVMKAFRLDGADGKAGALLCLPHRMKGEGQFAALLRKKGDAPRVRFTIPFPVPDRQAAELLRRSVPGIPEPNAMFGNRLVRVPECPEMKGVRILRAGLQLAEPRGKNPVPDHAAAVSVPDGGEKQTAALDATQAAAYIAGGEVPGDAEGWTVLTYRGLALGWGKGSGGTFKNHYPKGLRRSRILTEPE